MVGAIAFIQVGHVVVVVHRQDRLLGQLILGQVVAVQRVFVVLGARGHIQRTIRTEVDRRHAQAFEGLGFGQAAPAGLLAVAAAHVDQLFLLFGHQRHARLALLVQQPAERRAGRVDGGGVAGHGVELV